MEKSVEDSIRFYSQFKCVKRIHIVDLVGLKQRGKNSTTSVPES